LSSYNLLTEDNILKQAKQTQSVTERALGGAAISTF